MAGRSGGAPEETQGYALTGYLAFARLKSPLPTALSVAGLLSWDGGGMRNVLPTWMGTSDDCECDTSRRNTSNKSSYAGRRIFRFLL